MDGGGVSLTLRKKFDPVLFFEFWCPLDRIEMILGMFDQLKGLELVQDVMHSTSYRAPSNDISAFIAISLYRITNEYSLREKCVRGPGPGMLFRDSRKTGGHPEGLNSLGKSMYMRPFVPFFSLLCNFCNPRAALVGSC